MQTLMEKEEGCTKNQIAKKKIFMKQEYNTK